MSATETDLKDKALVEKFDKLFREHHRTFTIPLHRRQDLEACRSDPYSLQRSIPGARTVSKADGPAPLDQDAERRFQPGDASRAEITQRDAVAPAASDRSA
jgi:hypothetical protein